jgi:hypothetical protein
VRGASVLAFALASLLAFAASGEPAAPRQDAAAEVGLSAAAWEARLAEAHAALGGLRERAAASQRALSEARHRRHPRGEALSALEAAAAQARTALAAAEAEFPELLEQARREGVEPGVLRRFETEE